MTSSDCDLSGNLRAGSVRGFRNIIFVRNTIVRKSVGAAGALAFLTLSAAAQDHDPMVFYEANALKIRGHFQAGLNAVSESNLFWDLAAITAPNSGFAADTNWLEGYIKPGVSFEYQVDAGTVFHGMLSTVLSHTWGKDAFDTGNTGALTLEEAYFGIRGNLNPKVSYDISLGPRELTLGTGMLIANGATSGFERGALKLGPRKAWGRAAIGRLYSGNITGTAFYIDPNELPSTDSKNALAGVDVRFDDPRGGYLGATFVNVVTSQSPYPQAAPGGVGAPIVTPGARKGTKTLNVYGKANPLSGGLENWIFTGDFAYQWNKKIKLDAWAGRATAGYAFTNMSWSPLLTLGYQTFSGDDPNTATFERFDPLYYQGSPSAWATGSKSAATFINSNVNALSLALQVKPTQRDTLTLRYAHIQANELKSPVQFGQATRVDGDGNLVSGVTSAHLADDVFLEYNRIINPNTFLTAGVSVSVPGAGINNVLGTDAAPWTGGFINVVINF